MQAQLLRNILKSKVPHSQRGQVVVEYVLLLSVAVAIAAILISQFVKRDTASPENSGALIRKWVQMQQAIGNDQPNK